MKVRSSLSRSFLLFALGFGLASSGPVLASIAITRLDLDAEGRLRIQFADTPAARAYGLETRTTVDETGEPWQPAEALQFSCASPPVFEALIGAPAGDRRFYRVVALPEPESRSPQVLATEPAAGAADVPAELASLRVTFDRPMAGTVSWLADAQWGGSYATWSADRQMVEIHRFTAASTLPPLTTLRFTLNPNGKGFASDQGVSLAPYDFAFTVGAVSVQGPHVVSSLPANNAVEVDPLIDTVEFRFSEPMLPTGGFESSGWYPWTMSWSGDGRTCSVRRDSAGTPIYGQSVYLRPIFLRTVAGQPLATDYTLRFQTADPPATRVEANPARGFYWPYFLMVPPRLDPPHTLLVEPNNTGTWNDDPWVHETAARNLVRARSGFAVNLGCPLLVPVFPRPMMPQAPEPGGIYVHALDRYSLSRQWPGLERIDLQMVAMLDDALERLLAMGHAMDRRVFMMGFSASGAFTSRFAVLHPDRVKAAAPGSPGGWPLAPVVSWQGTTLKYAVGISDVETLSGTAFDLDTFRLVPLYIYVGDLDTNDALDTRGMTTDERNAICQLLNCGSNPVLAQRWPLAQAIHESVGANARFVIYPGVGHTITPQMFSDLQAFFREHR
jgi:hypothetical protein